MGDIDRGRANIAKSGLARPQAKIRVLEITVPEFRRQSANRVKTGPGHVKAKSGAAGNIDRFRIATRRCEDESLVDLIVTVRTWEAHELAIVAQGIDRANIWVVPGVLVQLTHEIRRRFRVGIEQDHVALRHKAQAVVYRADISLIGGVGDHMVIGL